jgi:hypothetical protein
MKNDYVVYLHERKDKPGYIFYCGSGKPRRPYHGKSKRNNYWNKIVNKHGYNIYIIATGLTKEESLCSEGFIGREYQNIGMCEACFDLPIDGTHFEHNEEIKTKISKILKEQYKNGRIPPFKDKKHSEESIEKQSKVKLGNTNALGCVRSEECKIKLSKHFKGKPNFKNKGKNSSVAKKVTNGEVCFYSASEASKFYGLYTTAISGAIRYGSKINGYYWEYI